MYNNLIYSDVYDPLIYYDPLKHGNILPKVGDTVVTKGLYEGKGAVVKGRVVSVTSFVIIKVEKILAQAVEGDCETFVGEILSATLEEVLPYKQFEVTEEDMW